MSIRDIAKHILEQKKSGLIVNLVHFEIDGKNVTDKKYHKILLSSFTGDSASCPYNKKEKPFYISFIILQNILLRNFIAIFIALKIIGKLYLQTVSFRSW